MIYNVPVHKLNGLITVPQQNYFALERCITLSNKQTVFLSLSHCRFCCSRLDLEMYNDNLSCTLKDIQIPKRISALMCTVWLSARNYQPFNSPCTSLAGKMRSHKVNRRWQKVKLLKQVCHLRQTVKINRIWNNKGHVQFSTDACVGSRGDGSHDCM